MFNYALFFNISISSFQKRFFSTSLDSINHDLNSLKPTQEIEPVLMENSCIYIFSRNSFNKNKNRIGMNPYLYKMNFFESIDIDTEDDFKLALLAGEII